MNQPGALRYFWELLWPGRLPPAVFATVLGYAIYLTVVSTEGFDQALGLLYVTQLLAASTGYRDRLIRGQLDGLLAGVDRRGRIVAAHLALSVVPGIALWIAFSIASYRFATRPSVGFSAGGLLAITYSSLMVWTLSAWLGKNTGGVLWLIGFLLLAGATSIQSLRDAYGTVSVDWLVTLRAAGAALILPLVMIGNGGHMEPPVLALISAATVAVCALGMWSVVRMDAPLKGPA
jgi:hypothetical protein